MSTRFGLFDSEQQLYIEIMAMQMIEWVIVYNCNRTSTLYYILDNILCPMLKVYLSQQVYINTTNKNK